MADPRPWEQRFSGDEIAEMLRRGACMCGIEAAQRNRFDRRTVVPTSANCEAHARLDALRQTPPDGDE
jgi:hypothetical protein